MKGIFWFLCGNHEAASSRLQGYIIHESLQKLGYYSQIVYRPGTQFTSDLPNFSKTPGSLDLTNTVSVIQKLRGPNTERLIHWLRQQKSRVIYVNCDLEPGNRSWLNADTVLVTTQELGHFHLRQGCADVRLIEEPYEFSRHPREKLTSTGKLKAVWFGYAANWSPLVPWKTILESEYADRIQLITCSDHPAADYKWSSERQKQLMLEADFSILPTASTDIFKVKSPNRLIQSMAAGLPVIVGPLPSFQKVRSLAPSVLEAGDGAQFRSAINKLLLPENRNHIAVANFEYVVDRFSPNSISQLWVERLDLSKDRQAGQDNYARFATIGKNLQRMFVFGSRLAAWKVKARKAGQTVIRWASESRGN
jgi:hypothetical protein